MITNKDKFRKYFKYRIYNIEKNENNQFDYVSLSDAFFKYYVYENHKLLAILTGVKNYINKYIKYINETSLDIISKINIIYKKKNRADKSDCNIFLVISFKMDLNDNQIIKKKLISSGRLGYEDYMKIVSFTANDYCLRFKLFYQIPNNNKDIINLFFGNSLEQNS